MHEIVKNSVRRLKQNKEERRKLLILLAICATLVVGIVMWQLMLPGIAMTGEAKCGQEGEEGHVHTTACYSDSEADVETEDDWVSSVSHLTFTDDWAANVTAVAASQLGYVESEKNYQVAESGELKGYTRYGAWSGNEYADWNVAFAAFCLNYAQLPGDSGFPVNTDLQEWIDNLSAAGLYGDASAIPAAGDLVILKKQDQETERQIGIVTKTEEADGITYVTAVEGNSNNKVEENTYEASGAEIEGYGLLNKAEDTYKKAIEEQNNVQSDVQSNTPQAAVTAENSIGTAETPNSTETTAEPNSTQSQFFSEPAPSDGQKADGTTVNQRLTLQVIEKETTTGKNGQSLYVSVNGTNSNPNDTEPPTARIDLSELPDGVTVAGFTDGEMQVMLIINSAKTDQETTVYLKTDTDGKQYVEFTPPAGSTVAFDLQFNSKNGIMDKSSSVTVTPKIPDATTNDSVSGPIILTWTGENVWNNLVKTVDKATIAVDGSENKLEGTLDYTITANHENADGQGDTGSIWTKEVQITDKLTLSDGISVPEEAKVEKDKIVLGSEVLFQFTELQGGTVNSITISPDRKSITYDVTIPNQYLEGGVPTKEQKHLSLALQLDASKLELRDNYVSSTTEQVAADEIKNTVNIETKAYKGGDSYKDTKEVITKPYIPEVFTVTKWTDKKEAKPGETIPYTISIKNDGSNPIKGTDAKGNKYQVVDKLPQYLFLTTGQIKALTEKGGTYNQKDGTITWCPGDIKAGETITFEIDVTLADAETMKQCADQMELTNSVSYKDHYAGETIKYKKPEITVTKTSDKSGSVSNGDIVTYTITIENKEDFESIDETITDVLKKGLVFQHMLDYDGNKVTKAGEFETTSMIVGTIPSQSHKVVFKQDEQKLTWELGKLAPKERVTLKLVCKVDTDQLDSVSKDKLKNDTTTTSGEGGSTEVGVEYPLSIDKKVEEGEEGTYDTEQVLNYSITINNAAGDKASQKDNLELTDVLPPGMMPYNYKLYTLIEAKSLGNIKTEDLQSAETDWKTYLTNTTDRDVYYTIINDEVVRVQKDRQAIGDNLWGAKLTWYIGKMDPGKSITKKYQTQIYMTPKQLAAGGKISYTNTATIDDRNDSVTVYGESATGVLNLKKTLAGGTQISETVHNNRGSIAFKVTCVDEDGNLKLKDGKPVYEKTFTLNDFDEKRIDWPEKTYEYTLKVGSLPYGKYKVEETNAGKFTGYTSTITVNDAEKNNTTVEFDKDNRSQQVDIVNKYVTTGGKIDIQKSVWSIGYAPTDYEQIKYVKDKYLYKKSGQSNYVIYNITVTNTDSKPVQLSKMTDQMTTGLTYVGFRSTLDWVSVNAFQNSNSISTSEYFPWADFQSDTSHLATVPIKMVNNDTKARKVTYTIGQNGTYSLAPGKAFSFFVLCQVNSNAALGVPLTNTASVIVDESVLYKGAKTVSMKETMDDSNQNHGNTTDEGVTNSERTISSSVDIMPKDTIVPGITKEAKAYIPADKTVNDAVEIKKKDNIQPNVTVKWEVKLFNDGTIPIKDYTIKDSVQSPFHILSETEAADIGLNKNAFELTIYDSAEVEVGTADLSNQIWDSVKDNQTSEFSIRLQDDEYQIPAGGWAVLNVYTKNIKFANKIYENTATLLPEQSFEAVDVKRGQIVSDKTDKVIGVKASDNVYAMGEFGSFSWKTIEEKGNSANKGYGDKGKEGQNYITLDSEKRYVTYTNNIENVSTNNFKNIVIIDMMPFTGDTGVLNQDEYRDSEFAVAFAEELKLYETTGNQQTPIDAGKYEIQFSSQTSFTKEDMNGAASQNWHSKWEKTDRSFRIVMKADYQLKSGTVLVAQYDGKIGEDANPGGIAWNSFGYQYTVSRPNVLDTVLSAEPPKVGVKIYKTPTIQKDVVDAAGKTLDYDESKIFTFNVYSGSDTSELLTTFNICQGGSIKINSITTENGAQVFENGKKYTITETVPDGYEFVGAGQKGTELGTENKYTFTYYKNQDGISILFKNLENGYELPETGGIGTFVYTAGGALLMVVAALLYGYRWRRKHERRRQ